MRSVQTCRSSSQHGTRHPSCRLVEPPDLGARCTGRRRPRRRRPPRRRVHHKAFAGQNGERWQGGREEIFIWKFAGGNDQGGHHTSEVPVVRDPRAVWSQDVVENDPIDLDYFNK